MVLWPRKCLHFIVSSSKQNIASAWFSLYDGEGWENVFFYISKLICSWVNSDFNFGFLWFLKPSLTDKQFCRLQKMALACKDFNVFAVNIQNEMIQLHWMLMNGSVGGSCGFMSVNVSLMFVLSWGLSWMTGGWKNCKYRISPSSLSFNQWSYYRMAKF